MQPYMVSIIPHLTTNCRVRHVRVSAPLIAALIDNQRYYLPDDLAPACGEELRPMFRPRISQPKPPPAPSLRFLVKTALRCQSAEELGEKAQALPATTTAPRDRARSRPRR
jgi:hypothetical protein